MKKILQIIVITLLFPLATNAQWVATTNPGAGGVVFIGTFGTKIFAGASSAVFVTTDTNTWTLSNTGITTILNCFATRGPNIFVGSDNGMYISTDSGSTWSPINNGLTTSYSKTIFSLAISGTNIFIGTDGGVFLSTNDGGLWSAVNTGLLGGINSLGINGVNIFAGSIVANGIFLSTNNGSNWNTVNTGLATFGSTFVNSFAFSGTNIFAATEDGVYLSTNNGVSWTSSNVGITSTYIYTLAASGGQIFAGTTNGMFLSVNNGSSWTSVNTGIVPVGTILSSAIIGTDIFIGTNGGKVYYRPLSEMTGIEEMAKEIPLTIAPNPFNSSTTLTFNDEQKNANVKIMDMLGKEIKSINFSGKQLLIEKDDMQEGIYIVQVEDENKNVGFRKIVVQ